MSHRNLAPYSGISPSLFWRGLEECHTISIRVLPPHCCRTHVFPPTWVSSKGAVYWTHVICHVTVSCMEQNPWEASGFTGSRGITHILWFITMHNTSSFPGPHKSSAHLPASFRIHLNIILPSVPRSSEWTFSFRFPHQTGERISHLPHTYHMLRPCHRGFGHSSSIC